MRLLGCIALLALVTGVERDCGFTAVAAASNISAVWANDGGDKVTKDELRATLKKENLTGKVHNRTWDGTSIHLYGARNEIVSFNLVLEAANTQANNVTVTFDTLTGPGYTLHSNLATGNGVFNWANRPIELFYTRYLQIKGLSFFGYGKFSQNIPIRFQPPAGTSGWTNRPDHDKFYPDILIPLELVKQFNIPAAQNESVWADIYIPQSAAPGLYAGNVIVQEGGSTTYTIPVQMTVYAFALPDTPTAPTMGILSTQDIMQRYVAGSGGYVNWLSAGGLRVQAITDRYYELFHRHKFSIVGQNECNVVDQPCASSVPRLNGSLYTATNGYDGPGYGKGNSVFSIGTYGAWKAYWPSSSTSQSAMWQHSDAIVNWFTANLPSTAYFLYLSDEPSGTAISQTETWANWIKQNPGAGKKLMSFSTHHPVLAQTDMPHVDIPVMIAGFGMCPGNTPPCNAPSVTQTATDLYRTTVGKSFWAYNASYRPASGSDVVEDDGVSPRQIAWAQYKKGIARWMYWYVNPDAHADWFQQANTWGNYYTNDPSFGMWNGTNGTGLLVYPGTDLYNPIDSYGVDGPFASLRLKEWRRGIQDTDYLFLANQVDPVATKALINSVIPKVLWEYPTTDPSYYNGPISWSSDPDVWEAARAQLAHIISPSVPVPPPPPAPPPTPPPPPPPAPPPAPPPTPPPPPPPGVTVNCVNSSGDVPAIQAAVNKGGTIAISGTCSFTAHVNVNNPVVVNGPATINALPSINAAFWVTSDNVTFNGLTFVQGGIYAPGSNIQKRSDITITNNTFRDFVAFNVKAGIETDRIADHWIISGNHFANFWQNGFASTTTNPLDNYSAVAGIVIWGGLDHTQVSWNTFDEMENDSMHFFGQGIGANGYAGGPGTGDVICNNVFTREHRMAIEWQDFSSGLSACAGGCNANMPTNVGTVVEKNYFHDPAWPYYGTFPYSLATFMKGPKVINNTAIIEASVGGNRLYGYPFEISAQITGLLLQGNIVSSILPNHTWSLAVADYPPGSKTNLFANNLFCGYIVSPAISQYGPHTETANYISYGACPGGVGTATSSINAVFTSPNNQTVNQGALATFKASVVSNLTINGVVYFLDGSSTALYTQTVQDVNPNFANDRTWLYHLSLSTAGLTLGNHTVTAIVYDVNHDVNTNAYVKISQAFTVN